MHDISFNLRPHGRHVIVNILQGDHNSEEFYDHHEAEALAEYLKAISDELMEYVRRTKHERKG